MSVRHAGPLGIGFLLSLATTTVLAADTQLELGEEVNRFTLKAINADVVKERFVSIDRFYGPEAEEPKKAILLTFFATYCEPCKREMPFLVALYDIYRDRGLAVISVSIDSAEEQVEVARKLAETNKVSFPMLSDNYNIVAKRYLVSKLPCVYIIDGSGRVAFANIGYNDNMSRLLLDKIREALGVPATDPVPELLAKHMAGNSGPAVVDAHTAAGSTEAEQPAAEHPAKAASRAKAKNKGKKRK
jgi:peroxiredoxin